MYLYRHHIQLDFNPIIDRNDIHTCNLFRAMAEALPVTAKDDNTSLADPAMLEKIDKLFACNVGNYIDLPQIVVVGDQSSGKSSGLGGLTGIDFARDSGLCTRFATQITFRRSAKKAFTASIVPTADSDAKYAERVRAWTKDVDVLDEESFADIMQEVFNCDIRSVNHADIMNRFMK